MLLMAVSMNESSFSGGNLVSPSSRNMEFVFSSLAYNGSGGLYSVYPSALHPPFLSLYYFHRNLLRQCPIPANPTGTSRRLGLANIDMVPSKYTACPISMGYGGRRLAPTFFSRLSVRGDEIGELDGDRLMMIFGDQS